jgi:TP901 family phage tail tape measure protein
MAINGGSIVAILEMDTSPYVAAQRAAVAQAGIFNDVSATTTQKLQGLAAGMKTVGTAATIGVTVPLVGLGVAAFKSAESVESAFAGVKKTVDASEAEFANLKQGLFDLSEEIPTTFVDLSKITELAGQLGVDNGNLLKFTRTIADLGESTNLTGEEAATMLAQYANVTGMPLDNIDRLGSVIVDLGNNVATTERDIATMAQRLSGTASILDLTDAQTMGLAATMSSLGIEAEAGGSAMSRTLSSMSQAVLGGGKSLDAFAKIAGTTGKNFASSFKGDPITALNSFVEGLGRIKASGGDVYAALDKVELGDIRVTETLLKMTGAEGDLTANINMATEAWDSNSALAEEAGKRYETTESQLQLAKNSIDNMTASLGDLMLPVVTDVTGGIADAADAINEMDDGTKGLILTVLGLLAAAGPLSLLIGGLVALVTGPAGIVLGVVAAGAAIVALVNNVNQLNQAKIDEDLANRFGDVKLSADEVDKVLQKTYKPIFNTETLTTAQNELEATKKKVTDLQTEIDKQEYLIKIGVGSPEALATSVKALIDQGQILLDQSKKTIALEITTFYGEDDENGQKKLTDLDQYFTDLQEDANAKGAALWDTYKAAMADGELDEKDLETVKKMQAEYQEMLRLATLEDTETKKNLLAYDAKNMPLSADTIKELAKRSEEIHQAEIAAEDSEWQRNREISASLYKGDSPDQVKDREAAIKEDDIKHEGNKITIAAEHAKADIEMYGAGVVSAYATEINTLQDVVASKAKEAADAAKKAATDYAQKAGLDLNNADAQAEFQNVYANTYTQWLQTMGQDITNALPAGTAESAGDMLGAMAPFIEDVKTTIAALESLGPNISTENQTRLDGLKAFIDGIKAMQLLTEDSGEIIGEMASNVDDQAAAALSDAQKAQTSAAQATPEGRAKAVADDLKIYSDALSAGISKITEDAWIMAEDQMWAEGVDTSGKPGKEKLKAAFQEALGGLAGEIDALVPADVKKKAQEALQALMPDIKAAKEQAAKMGDKVTPELQALLDMYAQIELLATGGSDIVTQLQTDIGSAASSAGSDAATKMGTAITTGIDSQATVIATSGANTGQGYVNGVLSKVKEAKDAGAALAAATDQGIRDKAVIASPSVMAMTDGSFVGEGYVKGVNEYVDRAYGEGEKLASATLTGMMTTSKLISQSSIKSRTAAEVTFLKDYGQQLLEIDRQTFQARLDQQERQHSVMMAMIGDYSAWYADTTLDTALEESAAFYEAKQDAIKAQYDADMAKTKKQAQKDALTASYNERIALISEQSTAEQNALRENYEIQQRIALQWINNQKELMNQELAAKQEAARKEDYEEELADLQKRQRQTKSARERRELQEQIDDMIRNEQLRQDEAAAQQVQTALGQMATAVSAGIIGLGDLTQNMNLPDVAFGSGGLGALTDITASDLDALLSNLSSSMQAGNSTGGFGIGNMTIDLRGAVVRDQSDIDAITDGVIDKLEDKLRSWQRD